MDQYRIKPKSRVHLNDFDANDIGGFEGSKKDGLKRLEELNQKLGELQEILYAGHKEKVLIVLQAMDSGGKDGTIRSVFDGVNPQGVQVASFKVPTPEELDHDYLWRIHKMTPAKGEIVIFNRSHYEDVLVVRVHELVPPKVWGKRFQQINQFEHILAEEGTTILKFFLMIDQEEQRLRLLDRIKDSTKQWKFNPNDLEERKLWNQYMKAYEDVLEKTSTSWAPWYVIPANRNWYRNLVISDILVETLKKLKLKYPPVVDKIESYVAALEKADPTSG